MLHCQDSVTFVVFISLENLRFAPWRCGRLYCSRVVFPVRILSQNNRLTLAAQATNNISPQQAAQNIEQRAQSVQLTVKSVKNRLVRFWRETQLSAKASTYDLQRIYDPRFWWFLHQKPLHPLTPAVEIGTQNKATVIYLPDNPKYRLFKQTVITVTAPDAQQAGIGGLLVVLNSRLVRIIDRSRELQALTQSRDTPVSSERETKTELQALNRRMALVMKAIELLTVTILLVALVVAVVFISVVTQLDLALLVVPLFVMAMVCLMAAALLFQREVQLATAQVRRWF